MSPDPVTRPNDVPPPVQRSAHEGVTACAGAARLPDARRLLVRGVNWLGDAVMTTPALLQLRAAYPAAHVSILCPAKLADLWLHHPAIDAVLAVGAAEPLWRVAGRIRQGCFDLGIVFPNSPRSAAELCLGGVPRRFGYSASWRRWLLTHPLPRPPSHVAMRKRSVREIRHLVAAPDAKSAAAPPPTAHQIHHYLHLVAAVGANPSPLPPRLVVSPQEIEAIATRLGLSSVNLPRRPLIGINPGAEYGPAKRWPQDRFAAVASELQRRIDCEWVIFGGRGDVELATAITARIAGSAHTPVSGDPARPLTVHNLAGRTSLRDLCAALSLCRVLLTNDTGPMHVAAAVGTPVIVPFGSTSPELTGPGLPTGKQHRLLTAAVPCRPCFQRECPIDLRCLQQISVETVVDELLHVLNAPAPQRDA